MSRRPFDPDRAAGSSPDEPLWDRPARRERPPAAQTAEAPRLTVSQLSDLIKGTLEQQVPSPLRVVGQVSNLSASHHWYFSLKDEQAVIGCVAWASTARRFGFVPADGDEVLATGHVSHYGPQGRTQLYVSALQPVGAGALELQFRELCRQLRELGYFDEDRKKPLPVFPRRVAVITSASGAAVQDVIATAAQRCRAVGLLVVDVRVQGDGAAEQVARAIGWVDRHAERLGVEAILVTRGGGSIEDLWAFNERPVADAAFRCRLPLVAAIGHESDTTVIELVADLRAATPTQAAMRLVPAAAELHRQAAHLEHRLHALLLRQVALQRQRLVAVRRHEAFARPRRLVERARRQLEMHRTGLARVLVSTVARRRAALERLAGRWARLATPAALQQRQQRLAILVDRLYRAVAGRIDQRRQLEQLAAALPSALQRHLERLRRELDLSQRRLAAVDPRQVLARGFTFTVRSDGRLVRSVRDATAGAIIETHLVDGRIRSVVHGRPAPARRGSAEGPDQMDLFDRPQ